MYYIEMILHTEKKCLGEYVKTITLILPGSKKPFALIKIEKQRNKK